MKKFFFISIFTYLILVSVCQARLVLGTYCGGW